MSVATMKHPGEDSTYIAIEGSLLLADVGPPNDEYRCIVIGTLGHSEHLTIYANQWKAFKALIAAIDEQMK